MDKLVKDKPLMCPICKHHCEELLEQRIATNRKGEPYEVVVCIICCYSNPRNSWPVLKEDT